eukprot:CAMPEP_0201696858 /NCGR_PEP_ID=MMETSP0578-20130828/8365_1 /ASSEMBLY_ACC=CAM_ASM_000663 /TAXON_ID=267565 /ORGANISM="Skeletonema grethea, Strain CCMP 1804" /LENGTH=569 /DNA_ID=CAMNT_0048182891 /DNA_START=174 /DNA_END=1883 /DNA_ORIENTATION=+
MSNISSRRRNYLLTPHRRDGLIEWMKSMLMHSFVLDALDTTGADTFSHFEVLIDEHRKMTDQYLDDISQNGKSAFVPSRLKQLVPQVGTFYTRLPLRKAFEAYNQKYGITKRRHICISFNEIRHILNLAQIIAMTDSFKGGNVGLLPPLVPNGSGGGRGANYEMKEGETDDQAIKAWTSMTVTPRREPDESDDSQASGDNSPKERSRNMCDRSESIAIEEAFSLLPERTALPGPKLICFDGDQTLYSDGANFESNPKLAKYLFLLLKHGVTIAVVTAAGYEYQAAKYELRLSGLLAYFKEKGLEGDDLERFYIFGGECNYLLRLGADYKLHAVKENGPGGWMNSTKHMSEAPGNWSESEVKSVLDMAEESFKTAMEDQNMRARIIRKKRSVGLIPKADEKITREALDEAVLRIQSELDNSKINLPFCAFNGGRDAWVDVGNKRVGVQVLQSYLGVPPEESLHIGDQFLNTGNDFAARSVCPCVWITSPEETSYILKSILRLAGVPLMAILNPVDYDDKKQVNGTKDKKGIEKKVDFDEMERRTSRLAMDVFTGEMIPLQRTTSNSRDAV